MYKSLFLPGTNVLIVIFIKKWGGEGKKTPFRMSDRRPKRPEKERFAWFYTPLNAAGDSERAI
jgi:hypothetical protein